MQCDWNMKSGPPRYFDTELSVIYFFSCPLFDVFCCFWLIVCTWRVDIQMLLWIIYLRECMLNRNILFCLQYSPILAYNADGGVVCASCPCRFLAIWLIWVACDLGIVAACNFVVALNTKRNIISHAYSEQSQIRSWHLVITTTFERTQTHTIRNWLNGSICTFALIGVADVRQQPSEHSAKLGEKCARYRERERVTIVCRLM